MLRRRIPSKIHNVLNQVGELQIVGGFIMRKPVHRVLQGILNVFTGGDLKQKLKDYNYDDLYHLSIVFILSNGSTVLLEKNQVINATINPQVDGETLNIQPPLLTTNLRLVISNTMNYMKGNFLPYNGKTNNCQDFIIAILKSNNMWSPDYESFIKQDVDELVFDSMPEPLEKVVNAITDLGGDIDTLVQEPTFENIGTIIKDVGQKVFGLPFTGDIGNKFFKSPEHYVDIAAKILPHHSQKKHEPEIAIDS